MLPEQSDIEATLVDSTPLDILDLLREEIKEMQETQRLSDDLLSYAWTIIANAGCGATHDGTIGWDNEAPDWHLAAITWRDRYHELIRG